MNYQDLLERGKNGPVREGFVCIGLGQKEGFLGLFEKKEIHCQYCGELRPNWWGDCEATYYYVPREVFDQKVNKMKYKYQIKIHGPEHGKLVQETLFARGFCWNGTGDQAFKTFKHGQAGEIVISEENSLLWSTLFSSSIDAATITLDDVFRLDLCYKKHITVKLNNTYDAVVSKDKIVVGCQEFPVSILADLVEALQKLD